jgi:hypothetical protein
MVADAERVPSFSGIEFLRIFAMPSTGRPVREASTNTTDDRDIDMMPTGSIARRRARGTQDARAQVAPDGLSAVQRESVRGYVLRGVYHSKALVQGPTGFLLVEPGADIPGVGRVLSLASHDGRLSLQTEAGVIGDE